MFRSLYARVLALAGTRWAVPTLAAVSFAESSFLPIPPDALLIPMVLARRERAWLYALVCTLGSVLGGLLGYAIGAFATPLGAWIFRLMGHPGGLDLYRQWFSHTRTLGIENGFWIILVKGLTPIPFKLVTIASGFAAFSLPLFIIASVVTRGGRFFLEAAALQHPAVKALVDRHLGWIVVLGAVAVVLALAAIKFIG